MQEYDVVICGGGLAGLTLARQLRLTNSKLSVAVVEKTERPLPEAGFKVGESSVEGGANYIGRTLGLHDYMTKNHFLKNGLRFFPGKSHAALEERSEIGPPCQPLLPAYQIDRGVFENDVRDMIREDGVELLEGFGLRKVDLLPGSKHRIHIQRVKSGQTKTINCRWLVDATGRRHFLKSQLNLSIPWEHKISAAWFRVAGRFDINDFVQKSEWHDRDPQNIRYLSTNHLMGKGYWVWIIPLASGHTSVGIVAEDASHPIKERSSYDLSLKWLKAHEPVVARHLNGKAPLDFLCFKNCSFGAKQTFSADRWSCVGEAGVFLDPLYSYGLDFLALSNCITVEMIERDLRNELTEADAREFNNFYLTLTENLVQLYNGSYHIFDKPGIVLAKLYWDTGFYWGFFAPLSFFEIYKKPELLSKLDFMRNTLALNLRMQQLFKDWARLSLKGRAPDFSAYPHLYSFLSRAHVELSRKKSQSKALRDIEKNARMLEDVARVWFVKAVQDTMPEFLPEIQARGGLNPYAIGLDPERWSEEGLFGSNAPRPTLMEKDIGYYLGEVKATKFGSALHLLRLYLWAFRMRGRSIADNIPPLFRRIIIRFQSAAKGA